MPEFVTDESKPFEEKQIIFYRDTKNEFYQAKLC